MKARHLEILQEKGFPVPKFILVSENEEVDLSFSEKEYFAVRSNFSAEDGGEHSFAGQFLTRLNVKREKVQEAVQEVFDSYAGSLEYKEKANRGKTEYYLKEQGKAEKQKNAERQEESAPHVPRDLPPNSNTARMREPNGSTFLWQQPTRRFAPLPTAPIPRGFGYDPETFATVRASRLPP